MREVVIVSAVRTAIGGYGGTLKNVSARELGAVVIKGALEKAGVKPEMVDEVIMGNVLQAGLGQNVSKTDDARCWSSKGSSCNDNQQGLRKRTKSC